MYEVRSVWKVESIPYGLGFMTHDRGSSKYGGVTFNLTFPDIS